MPQIRSYQGHPDSRRRADARFFGWKECSTITIADAAVEVLSKKIDDLEQHMS
jgi:hypothetical protein